MDDDIAYKEQASMLSLEVPSIRSSPLSTSILFGMGALTF